MLEGRDNSGQSGEVHQGLGGSRPPIRRGGDVIVVSIKEALPGTKVKKGGRGARRFVVRTKIRRRCGTVDTSVRRETAVLVTKEASPSERASSGRRRELRARKFMKIISLALGGIGRHERIRKRRNGRRHQREGRTKERKGKGDARPPRGETRGGRGRNLVKRHTLSTRATLGRDRRTRAAEPTRSR